jgi:hypothetical protein
VPYKPISSTVLTAALKRLGELARARGVILELSLYGGAVFTLVYGSRDSTRDVDAVFSPSKIGKEIASEVSREFDLPEDWLNDDVKQFVSEQEAKRRLPKADFEGLNVSVPTANYLLAMKLRSCRPPLPGYAGDYGDIEFLMRKMKIRTLEQAVEIHDKFFPHDVLSEEARLVVAAFITSTDQ